jgi:2-polyprenyl-3-methyl-5-hydroxy-6-metoxy-1,4-benzoquinol methylase
MASSVVAPTAYTHKSGPYSSHTLLVNSLDPYGAGKRVLDVGCAGGYLAGILAQRGYEVVGIERPGGYGDHFPEGVTLVEADLDRGLPPLQGRFSYVICGDILEHLRDPGRLLEQIGGVLAPDGLVIASLPNSGNLYFRLVVLSGRFPQEDKGLFDRTHLHFYTWKGWRELLSAAGFQIGGREVSGIPVGLAAPNWDGSAVIRAMEVFAHLAARLWPTLFAYQFIVTASRRQNS